jgi:predicted RNase H-like nuclease (RuvC/YqgF family)
MEKIIEKERKMTIDGHTKGSSVSHNKGKENASAIDRNRMSNEEFNREMAEMKAHIDMLKKMLHKIQKTITMDGC